MNSYSKIFRIVLSVVVVLGALGLVVAVNNIEAGKDKKTEAMNNLTYFSDFTLYGLDGEQITSDDIKQNKITVVNGWAPWCNPCTSEMPELEELSNEYKDKGLKVVGVVADYYEQTKTNGFESYNNQIREVVARTGVTYPIVVSDEAFYNALNITISGYPTTWAVNSKGEVIETVVGSRSKEDWKVFFDKWLGEVE